MERSEILAFLRSQKYAVQASTSKAGKPQAAVVGVAVMDDFVVVLDTLESTRKAINLRGNPSVALVFGGWCEDDERTVQYDGMADFPKGEELGRIQAAYFGVFPNGPSRLRWPGITYVRIKPIWLRYCDFNAAPPLVVEFNLENDS